jgi:hypothetical protein
VKEVGTVITLRTFASNHVVPAKFACMAVELESSCREYQHMGEVFEMFFVEAEVLF